MQNAVTSFAAIDHNLDLRDLHEYLSTYTESSVRLVDFDKHEHYMNFGKRNYRLREAAMIPHSQHI